MYNLRLRPTQRSAALTFAGLIPQGEAAVVNFVTASGTGAVGTTGVCSATEWVTASGAGEEKPTATGEGRFSSSMASASGYVGIFGPAAASVILYKAASGYMVPFGTGNASGIVQAIGVGAGGRVTGSADGVLSLVVDAVGGLELPGNYIVGRSSAQVAVQGSGAGLSARMATGTGRVSIAGSGTIKLGASGRADCVLRLPTLGIGHRGSFGSGGAQVRLSSRGYGLRGETGVGGTTLPLKCSGVAAYTRAVTAIGSGVVGIFGSGSSQFGEQAPAYDTIFVRTRSAQSYVKEAL